MTFRGDDDDTSAGRITQGGSPDHGAPGPGRQSGHSIWWFAAVALIALLVVLGFVTGRLRRAAPAERNTVTITGEAGPCACSAPGIAA